MASTSLRLRALREQRGWTQQDVAEQVARLAWLRRNERVGVNADMVAKWERGQKKPSSRYRELLSMLFGQDARTLGFAGPVPLSTSTPGGADDSSLIGLLRGSTSLLAQFGTAAAILQPRMSEVWKDEPLQRRALLKLMGLATTAGVVPGLGRELTESGTVTPEVVQDLDRLADHYQELYHSIAPAVLMAPVQAHLEKLSDFLRKGVPAALRQRVFANRAQVATLAGRLAFFDLKDSLATRGYYNLALESARQAGDHPRAAVVLGLGAFIPAAELSYGASLDYLQAATQQARKRSDGRVASWLLAVESEIHTNAGSHVEALRMIDQAREKLADPGLSADLPWFDYYDSTRLSGFAGYALLGDKQFDSARKELTGAAESLPSAAVKQKAVYLADIAMAELAGGDLDEACASASDAADQLRQAGYAIGIGRLREFRLAVEPWASSPPVAALDEQLALL